MAPAASAKARSLGWPAVVGLAITALLLWWALHDVRLRDVLQHLRLARPLPFLGAAAVATATFPLRTIRWRYLLRRDGAVIPMGPLWHATAIGFMANNLLPARAGELARTYAATRLAGVRFTAAAASVAVERVLDGLVLVGLLAAGLTWGGFSETTTVGGVPVARVARLALLVFVPTLVLLLGLVHWRGPALRGIHRALGRVMPSKSATRVVAVLEGLLEGLEALRSPRRLTLVTLWSLVIWLVMALSFGLAFVAFRLPVPPSAALLLMGLVAFGVAIPSSPGFFGPFEAVTRATLALYGVGAAAAVSYAVAYHIAAFLPISMLGLWSLSRAHLHLAELKTESAAEAAGTAGAAAVRDQP